MASLQVERDQGLREHMLGVNADDCSQCFMKGVMQGYIYTEDPINILISTRRCLNDLQCRKTLDF